MSATCTDNGMSQAGARLNNAGREPVAPGKMAGTYLITGGLGGLGLIVAREIAAQAKDATLILVGRSPLPQDLRM